MSRTYNIVVGFRLLAVLLLLGRNLQQPATALAQSPPTAGAFEAMQRDLARMQAELHALRLRVNSSAHPNGAAGPIVAGWLAEDTADPVVSDGGIEPLPPLDHGGPPSGIRVVAQPAAATSSTSTANELSDVLHRLEALEQDKAKALIDKKEKDEWIDLSNEKWNVKLGGHVQTDYIMWPERDENITSPLARNYFEFRRLRLDAQGTGYGVYDFRLQMTLEPETVGSDPNIIYLPTVKDAYFSINEVPWLGRFRIGNFFVPFSLEQVTNDTNTVFLERAIPAQGTFTGGREVGLASYNVTEGKNATWTNGFFFDNISDTGIDRTDMNQGYRISSRVTYLPYYDEPSNGRYMIHTGAGVLYTHDHDETARFRARPQIHTGPFLIDTGNIEAEHFTIGNLEFAAVMGPLAVQSEFFVCDVDRADGGPTPLYGAYAYCSYFLTGENRQYERFGQHGAQFGRPTPFSNVFFTKNCCSLGAWEVKARWSHLDFGNVDSGQYNDFTFGFNWWWSDRVRLLFDWIHPVTTSETVFGATQSDIIGMRFDFNW